MASLAVVDLEKQMRENSLCAICIEIFKNPKLLPGCGHTFCSACLEQLLGRGVSPNWLLCPLCRRPSRVPAGGARALNDDRSARAGVELLEFIKAATRCRIDRENKPDGSSVFSIPVGMISLKKLPHTQHLSLPDIEHENTCDIQIHVCGLNELLINFKMLFLFHKH